jgi:hypothetical protein
LLQIHVQSLINQVIKKFIFFFFITISLFIFAFVFVFCICLLNLFNIVFLRTFRPLVCMDVVWLIYVIIRRWLTLPFGI